MNVGFIKSVSPILDFDLVEDDIGKSELEKTKRNGGSSEAIIRQSEEVKRRRRRKNNTINYINSKMPKSELKKE